MWRKDSWMGLLAVFRIQTLTVPSPIPGCLSQPWECPIRAGFWVLRVALGDKAAVADPVSGGSFPSHASGWCFRSLVVNTDREPGSSSQGLRCWFGLYQFGRRCWPQWSSLTIPPWCSGLSEPESLLPCMLWLWTRFSLPEHCTVLVKVSSPYSLHILLVRFYHIFPWPLL